MLFRSIKLYMFPYNEYDILLLTFGTGLVLSLSKVFNEIFNYLTDGRKSRTKEYEDMVENRLNDFSHVFDRISKVMSDDGPENRQICGRDIRKIFREMSENVCARCEKYEECSGQTAICRPEKFRSLSVSGDGFIKIEQMPMEFARDCIHPEQIGRASCRERV